MNKKQEKTMKRTVALIAVFVLIAENLFAADGDLIVNGKVGVGTTTPGYKLDILGNARVNGDLIRQATGAFSAYKSVSQNDIPNSTYTIAHILRLLLTLKILMFQVGMMSLTVNIYHCLPDTIGLILRC